MDDISQINIGNILSTQDLKDATSAIAAVFKKQWDDLSKEVYIHKRSKE